MAQYALNVSQSSCEVDCHGAQWSIVLCQFSASSQDPSETDSFRVRVAPYGYAFISDGQLFFLGLTALSLMHGLIYVSEYRDIRALRRLCGQPVSREFLLILSCHLSPSVQGFCRRCNSSDNFEVTRVGDPSQHFILSSDPQGGACNQL